MARDDVLKSNLTKGAVGLAITAGAIAAGMLLSDQPTRKRFTRKARNTSRRLKKTISTIAEEYPEYRHRFQATAHNLRLGRGKGRSTGAVHKVTSAKRGRKKAGKSLRLSNSFRFWYYFLHEEPRPKREIP